MLTILLPLSLLFLTPMAAKTKWHLSIPLICLLTFFSVFLMFSPLSSSSMSSLIIMDELSASMCSLTLWVTVLMIMNSSKAYNKMNMPALFISLVALLCAILLMSFSTNSILVFYIMFEASLIPTLILILLWGYQPERLQAGMYLMMYTTVASLPLLVAILFASNEASSNFMSIPANFYLMHSLGPMQEQVWWLFCLLAFLVKMPMYVTHLWLPKAHVEAPVAGSMILAGVLLKLGGYGIMRMIFMAPTAESLMCPMILSISLVGAIGASLSCTRQPDMKSLIAYASVAHMALLIVGLFLQSMWGFVGALLMMIAHGLASSGLFSLANSMYESTKTRSMMISKGIMYIAPVMSMWVFIMLASNMGAPPSMNLTAEIFLLSNILNKSLTAYLPMAIMSFYAAVYSLLLFTNTQHGQSPEFTNPLSMTSTYWQSSALLHTLPIAFFLMKPDLLSICYM